MESQGTILLVDDEPFVLSAVGNVLRTAGFQVHTCEMWAGVANVIRREDPDVVLLDYNMPTVKGDDICLILKKNTRRSRMRIVMYSSEQESVIERVAAACGADGFIRKNTPGGELVDRLLDHVAAARADA